MQHLWQSSPSSWTVHGIGDDGNDGDDVGGGGDYNDSDNDDVPDRDEDGDD